MKESIIQFLLLVVGLLMTQCVRYRDPALAKFDDLGLMFSDSQKDSVLHEMETMTDLMRKIADRGKFDEQQIGYFHSENSLYFRHCLPQSESKYLPSGQCNVDSFLSAEERQTLYHAIEYLESVGVSSCYCYHIFDNMLFQIDVPAKDLNDGRILCLTNGLDTAFVNKTNYRIIEQTAGLTLLKQHYY